MREHKFKIFIAGATNKFAFHGKPLTLKGISALGESYFREDCIWLESTGLLDKNGVEVYEGDIIQCLDFSVGETTMGYKDEKIFRFIVQWDSSKAKFAENLVYCSDENILQDGSFLTSGRVKVIGNIYENKNLLEKCR